MNILFQVVAIAHRLQALDISSCPTGIRQQTRGTPTATTVIPTRSRSVQRNSLANPGCGEDSEGIQLYWLIMGIRGFRAAFLFKPALRLQYLGELSVLPTQRLSARGSCLLSLRVHRETIMCSGKSAVASSVKHGKQRWPVQEHRYRRA